MAHRGKNMTDGCFLTGCIRMASHDIKIDTREELVWKVKTEVLRVSDHISLLIFLCKTVIIILS